MWESPINMIYGEMQMQMEGDVLKAVQNVGIHVNKEELLKALEYSREQYDKGYDDGYLDGFTAESWIPCSERYPEEAVYVLVYDSKHDAIDVAEFLCPHWYTRWSKMDEEITAWMPLPEPYKAELEEEK